MKKILLGLLLLTAVFTANAQVEKYKSFQTKSYNPETESSPAEWKDAVILIVKNMDKKIYEIDSMAMMRTGSQVFRDFYNKRQGGISMKAGDLKKLHAYMEKKREVYETTALNTLRKLYKKENIEK